MSSSTYKNSQASWRSGSSTASERYLGATSNASTGNGSTANSLATGLTSSKYSAGNASRTSKTDFSASASKQKDTNAPAGTNSTNLSATLNTGGTSPLSRFSSSRSSLNGASGSTSGLASIGKNISGSTNSIRDSSAPSSQTYREKSNVSSSGTSMTLREKYSAGKNEKNSVLGSTSTLMASIRDKSGLNAASGSTVRREKSNVSSSTSSSISSASMKREKSNASTTSVVKDKIGSSSSSASGATALNTSFSEKSKQLLASLSSTDTSAVSGYRSSSTFLRPTSTSTAVGNQATSRSTTDNTRASSKLFPLDQGKKTDSLLSTLSSGGSNAGTGNVTGTGGTSNFKIFTTKDIEKPAPIIPVESAKPLGSGNSAAMTSSLRTTARFGLRSGTSHAQYNSSLPCKPVLEDIKPATKNRNQKKGSDGPKSWMTRGTSPDPSFQDASCTFKRSKYPSAISMEEIPAISPKFDITIVVKNKECQTEVIREPPKPLSSIPRPSALMFNAFNPVTRFGSKGGRGCTPSDGNESPSGSETKLKVTKRNNDAGSTEELPGRPAGQKKNSLAQKQRQSSSSPHSSPCRKLDSGSPVPQQGKIEKVICTEMNAPEIIGSNAGIVVTLPNKEFRKSALNVGESDCTAEEEFNKTHDEMKRLSMNSQTIKSCAKSIPHPADSADPFTRRPPTDPTKSPTNPPIAAPGDKFSPASGISKLQKGTLINTSALAKMKSGKNLIPIRKNSTSSCSESESSSSMSSSSKSSSSNKRTNPDVKRVASQLIYGESNVSQGRRGSVTSNTSCSSAASSRSSSSERQIPRVNLRPNCPATASPSKSLEGSGQEAVGSAESREDPQPKQTSFLLRALASAEDRLSWVRRCESGEIPWWMAASNKNVPGLLAKNLSSATLIAKSPTTKQMPIYEDDPSAEVSLNPHASHSEESENTNMEHQLGEMSELPSSAMLEERTSPDGGEISAEMIDSIFHATLNSEKPRGAKSQAKQPFIGNMTNIDDILGTFCPSPVPVPPLISPENFNPLQQSTENDSACNSRSKDQEDQDSSDDSSDEEEAGAGESNTETKKKPITDFDDDDDDSSDDGGSTGTSSSFEEMDPEALIIQSFETLNISIKNNEASSNSSGTMLPPGSIETVQDECTTADNICQPLDHNQPYDEASSARELSDAGLIPQSQREKLDDATLQLYKDGDFGTYLDLEASISEQQDDFEGFFNNRKNSIVLRAQLPVRVHAIIEKLLNSDGRELRRALFSLKQIFQEDKDLVHEFVENGGLSCLIKVGSDADQNYQNYILRAIGQVMLYVDGMYGVMRHNETVQWLYSLVASKFRLVQKTALKLLLVFVDYVESNCLLLVQAVTTVDIIKGCPVWNNVMSLLREHDSGDTELLVYGMTLVNKVLNGITDIETYYDQVDALEEQGMASLIQKCMGKQCADLDLIQQFQIYEVVLKHEDGEEDNIMMHLDENMRQKLLNRKGYGDGGDGLKERRKSRRHSANGTPPSTPTGNGSTLGFLNPHVNSRRLSGTGDHVRRDSVEDWSSSPSSSHSSSPAPQHGNSNESTSPIISNGYAKDKCISNDIDVTPGLRRRRERAERQKSLILEQKQVNGSVKVNGFNNSHDSNTDGHTTDDSMGSPVTPCSPVRNPDSISLIPLGRSNSIGSKKDSVLSAVSTNGNHQEVNNLVVVNGNGANNNNNNNNSSTANNNKANRPWMLPTHPGGKPGSGPAITGGNPGEKENSMEKEIVESDNIILRRESTVKDLTQKLANQSLITSPVDENKSFSRTGDLSGVVSKAKEGLAKSKSRADIKPPQAPDVVNGTPGTGTNGNSILEAKKSDNELHWDFLVSNLNRPLEVCDLDFTDLKDSDDTDILAPSPHLLNGSVNGLPPPVPTMNGFHLGPPPPPPNRAIPPPPMANGGLNGLISNGKGPPAPPLFGVSLKHPGNNGTVNGGDVILAKTSKKTKKTVKLFWKEVREDPVTAMKIQKVGCLWDELAPIPIDTQRLEHLFESRAKDVITKKQTDLNKSKEIVVLDPKRSNAINIGMTKLPPPRTIKAAIMKMDATIINREGIEKLLTMLPTEEERAKIQEAQFANPEIPLGSAEQFLLTLASISELSARLKLWAFKLDYENLEKEVAEPLMDLKQGMEALEKNKTFRCILTTLLCIGNFLNGAEAKGFQIEYLSKVPEVKDTVHKHSLLHHLCHIVIEKFPESTDLYSEIGPVTRASRVDFDEVATNLGKMETDCKSSWDHLRVIAKHDGPTNMKLKMSEFLADCAERIIVLGIVHRRVTNRYHKFLLWLGVLAHQVTTTKPHVLFKVISEFALEYRTTRERVIQQLQKKANHRERNKTRGKMITEQLVCKNTEDKADAELRQVLTTNGDTSEGEVVRGALTWQRRTKTTTTSNIIYNNNKTATLNGHGTVPDGDDEILESLVKTATSTPATRAAPRERKRNSRCLDRKSLRRTLRHGLSEEERKLLAAFMANGHSF